ncbi:hypothetical protein TcasGA2_TC032410 [Tribolium castaneum]|uniref:Uncharacterized protein n=1 Tax=Tribolium castaneum TaxID=7070 RepID=A0A139WLI9_TRICA|nr:hypothetical protein TcasGA2_TC032410 [Tribolium castaneum]
MTRQICMRLCYCPLPNEVCCTTLYLLDVHKEALMYAKLAI